MSIVVSGFSRTGIRFIKQSNPRIERRRTQVHVAPRRVEVLVSGQFLDLAGAHRDQKW